MREPSGEKDAAASRWVREISLAGSPAGWVASRSASFHTFAFTVACTYGSL